MTPRHDEDSLLAAIDQGTAYVKVCGRGTFKISGALKQFGKGAIASDCTAIVLDMTECVGMDSTFMGVIAGLSSLLKEKGRSPVIMVNLSDKTSGLLATLGLDQIVAAHLAGQTPEGRTPAIETWETLTLPGTEESRTETATTMLEAHENLVDLSPENYPRFKDVLTFLKEDIEKAEPGRPDGSAPSPGK